MIIIFVGPPGSGKGTQAAIISKELSIPSLSTSAILAEVINNGGELAKELKDYMSSGKLVPSALVNEMVATALTKSEYSSGCILDGYPRNIDQAEFLDIRFPKMEYKVVYFDISYEALASRIEGRYSCVSCGAIYNKFSSNTTVEGICDVCGATEFKIREDDKLEVLYKRWEVYIEETKPLLEYYKNKGCLVSVDATLDKTDITNNLLKALKL